MKANHFALAFAAMLALATGGLVAAHDAGTDAPGAESPGDRIAPDDHAEPATADRTEEDADRRLTTDSERLVERDASVMKRVDEDTWTVSFEEPIRMNVTQDRSEDGSVQVVEA